MRALAATNVVLKFLWKRDGLFHGALRVIAPVILITFAAKMKQNEIL
jgi:hypothetical protein